MIAIIRERFRRCQCRWLPALLLVLLAMPPVSAAGAAPAAETAELWLYAGRIWQEAATLFRLAGPEADGQRHRALLYAKEALLEAAQDTPALISAQRDEVGRELAAVDAALEQLVPQGYLNLTAAELLVDRGPAARQLLLHGLESDGRELRRAVLREWLRARESWTALAQAWATTDAPEQQARLAATVAEIDAHITRLQTELAAEQQVLALNPVPRAAPPAPPALPPIPLPEIRFTPATADATGGVPPDLPPDSGPPPPPEREWAGIVDLQGPLESTLVINGRKSISMSVSSTSYPDNPDATLSSTSLDIEQQLQVHITGTVGKTITVNVDYDDAKAEVERQTMSIMYQSLEHQTPVGVMNANAAFGDISLSIPSTQFVSYNTSLFGVQGGAEINDFHLLGMSADRLSLNAVVSRAKGESGRKVFYGAATNTIVSIADISYLADKYFQVTEQTGTDVAPLVMSTLQVWCDDHNATSNDANTVTGMRVTNGSDSYTGDFDLLQAGPDYAVDNLTGVIKFRTGIGSNYVIAVGYTTTAGKVTAGKMIRDENASDTYNRYELRNRYDLGSLNIVADDPDFLFEIRGSNDKPDTDSNGDGAADRTWLNYFGLDRSGLPGNDGIEGTADDLPDGKIDDEWIDFDFGIVTFPDSEPFRVQNPTVYKTDPTARFTLHLEYKQKTQSYTLGEFNIIKGSERVTIGGNEIGSDQYYLDYESGFLTFYNADLITPNAEIVIDYQYLPFGGQFQQTAVAVRTEAEINDNLLLGTTVIRNWDAKSGSMPDVTAAPAANLVWDLNTVFDPLNVGVDLINLFRSHELPQVEASVADLSITAEYAQSINDPNTFGSATIDSIESLEETMGFPKSERSWCPATVPAEYDFNLRGRVSVS
ncbi:MAG TPA: hypothetical protein PKM88_01885, partial [bacterium]|nr:hypothetical protein [bacterium]